MKYGVFISYSHEDKQLIAPVVQIIQSTRHDLVFQDYASLQIGKKWEPQLLEAMANAKMVFVFWCKHAAQSQWVKKEYRLAMQEDKDIVPVMLDETKLPRDLAAYQGINMSHVIVHQDDLKVESKTLHDDADDKMEQEDGSVLNNQVGRKVHAQLLQEQKMVASRLEEEINKRL